MILKLEKEENQKNLKLNKVIDSLNSQNINLREELDFWTNKTKSLEDNVIAFNAKLDNLKQSFNNIQIEN